MSEPPEVRDDRMPGIEALVALYDAVGWSAYTAAPDVLVRALAGSLRVVTAWRGDRLVGLARIVGDGATIAYLQDVLVHPDHRRSGLGSRMVAAAFAPFGDVRQQVLLTDDEPGQRAFYESLGFTEVHDVRPRQLRAFVRFRS
ncbi:N-acetyltransferase [Agromyces rhizosphaerae]|uniref:N-acetyltransferase n=1 Tax=Agromyces rhizosphaerae TaxID=88374 RepID=A0A9W6FS01_9MICO|nr:GNAT family N-acetyltransferase [Agromyces rhizosphaerae]GLI27633.1 N-acetyltransferase [Agromyces rhizosphaerae]